MLQQVSGSRQLIHLLLLSSRRAHAVFREGRAPLSTRAHPSGKAARGGPRPCAAASHHTGSPQLAPAVTEALQLLGLSKPTDIQELAFPALLAGRNAVLAAETGSGKTFAYLAPLVSRLLELPEGHSREGSLPPAILVLCPNASLCNQVVSFAHSLRSAEGEPVLSAVFYSTRFVPVRGALPEVLVATPAGLISATQNCGPFFGKAWSRDGIVERARAVVLDEADLLLTGGYQRDVRLVLDALRASDKARKAGQVCREVGLAEEEFKGLPRHLRKAALEGGADGLKAAGFKPPEEFLWDAPSSLEPSPGAPQRAASAAEGGPAGSAAGRGGVASLVESWKRQYVFAAATLPEGPGKSVSADIRQLVPDAEWVSTRGLHRGRSEVTHHWTDVRPDTQQSTLQAVVLEQCGLEEGQGRVLVFCNDVGSAKEASRALQEAGVTPLEFHREVSPEECAAALEQMQTGEGVVMVCTDAAARGIDIPGVTAVVQADFPTSAVTFLHRVGRTARAGSKGAVFSLVPTERQVLADALRDALEAGESVEGAFSRNRSFAKKLRRYGKYVPRGEVVVRAEGSNSEGRQRQQRATF